jgi:NAD(P)-dependent dehydrogenase (short-subunit alcohol dehydrogenase family)
MAEQLLDFSGKVVLITGGSTSIGLANAERSVVGASAIIARRR